MAASDFLLWPELEARLRQPASGGAPLYELVVPPRPMLDDLALVPDDARFLRLSGKAAAIERLGQLESLVAAWASPATPRLLESCRRPPRLRALYIMDFGRLAEVDLRGADALEHLLLNWAPCVTDLSFLADLPELRTLYLDDLKRLDLATLPALPMVTALHLAGGMWSALKVQSFAPLARLPNLQYLSISNVRPLDDSLEPLSTLVRLRRLELPNLYPLEEMARLSAALPTTDGNAFSPVYAVYDRAGHENWPFRCDRCGGRRQMMTGRPASMLCARCDAGKIERRVARWEIARSSSWPAH